MAEVQRPAGAARSKGLGCCPTSSCKARGLCIDKDIACKALCVQKHCLQMCKFTRFMLRLTYSSMHIARANFIFVPDQDFTEEWTDEKLYRKYELTEDEIAFIESTIRAME